MPASKKSLAPAFSRVVNSIRSLMVTGAHNEALNKHKIGLKVLELRDDVAKYGKNSVGKAARQLGCTGALLYSYATVAETWKEPALQALLKKRGSSGVPLTFSHLIELAKVKSEQRRRVLIGRALKESWSVRALAAKVPQKKGKEKAQKQAAPKQIAATIAVASSATVQSIRDHLSASLRIDRAAVEDSEVRKRLQAARDDLRKTRELTERLEAKLTKLLESAGEIQRKAA